MNVLITGGTGYIGSHLALDLVRRGHSVTAVARAPGPGTSTSQRRASELRDAGVTLIHADLSRRGELSRCADPAEVEVIIHGVCSFLEPAEGESLTLVAMEELLLFAARCPKLVQIINLSNNLVLEPPAPDAFPDESAPCHPETAHGRNKLKAEQMLEHSGRPWTTLRIPQVYGGWGSSFDWIMVEPIRRGAFPVPGAGRNRVSLVHVDDVVQAVLRAIEHRATGRVFNVSTGERNLTLGEVFDTIASGFGLPEPRRLPRRAALLFMGAAERWARLRKREPSLVADMVHALSANRSLDNARIRRELGFEPTWPNTVAGIKAAYAEIFAGRAQAFNPPGRLGANQGASLPGTPLPTTASSDDGPSREDFWARWSRWRHGEPGQGNFADVQRVLGTYQLFADCAADHLEASSEGITVLDLASGAVPLAGPLLQALEARGGTMRRYLGVDYADPVWMPVRVAEEFRRNGLSDRGEYLHHDLSLGLPAHLEAKLGDGPLLIASCWGITYLERARLRALLDECAALAARRPGGAVLYINMMSEGQFDRDVLTRRFLGEVVPRHVWTALRTRAMEPLHAVGLAMKALPEMRRFGDEVKHIAKLMPVSDMLELLSEAGYAPAHVDDTGLWGQTTGLVIRLPEVRT